jgi:hypothetical protein
MYVKILKNNLEYDDRKNLELLGINLNDTFLAHKLTSDGDIMMNIDDMTFTFISGEYQIVEK